MNPTTYGIRRKGTAGVIGIVPAKVHAKPPSSNTYLEEYEEVPLYTEADIAELIHEAMMFRFLATHQNLYTVADLLKADQYVTLRRACEALMPLECANPGGKPPRETRSA